MGGVATQAKPACKIHFGLQKNHEAWKEYSKKVVCSCLDIESTNKQVRERVLESMDRYDQQVLGTFLQSASGL